MSGRNRKTNLNFNVSRVSRGKLFTLDTGNPYTAGAVQGVQGVQGIFTPPGN